MVKLTEQHIKHVFIKFYFETTQQCLRSSRERK